ncbi:MAG: hypothetical protein K2J79_11200, partial [Ruminiclostridium sp.]|nr:hypothetical protein [Ruminiclostridium sp.]
VIYSVHNKKIKKTKNQKNQKKSNREEVEADMAEVKINKTQAQAFAQAIFADIEDYVKTHQREFEEFLKEESEVVKLCSDEEQPINL